MTKPFKLTNKEVEKTAEDYLEYIESEYGLNKANVARNEFGMYPAVASVSSTMYPHKLYWTQKHEVGRKSFKLINRPCLEMNYTAGKNHNFIGQAFFDLDGIQKAATGLFQKSFAFRRLRSKEAQKDAVRLVTSEALYKQLKDPELFKFDRKGALAQESAEQKKISAAFGYPINHDKIGKDEYQAAKNWVAEKRFDYMQFEAYPGWSKTRKLFRQTSKEMGLNLNNIRTFSSQNGLYLLGKVSDPAKGNQKDVVVDMNKLDQESKHGFRQANINKMKPFMKQAITEPLTKDQRELLKQEQRIRQRELKALSPASKQDLTSKRKKQARQAALARRRALERS